MSERPITHFVGFKGEEWFSAVKIWGQPHFIHRHNDARVQTEVADGDLVIYANGSERKLVPFVFNDSECF